MYVESAVSLADQYDDIDMLLYNLFFNGDHTAVVHIYITIIYGLSGISFL